MTDRSSQTKRAADREIDAARFRGFKSGRAGMGALALAPRQVTRQMRALYPETEHPQANLRVPAIFARSLRMSRYAAACTFKRACIVANVPPGATMPQDAPGAVGEHGCRRRDATLPCATERCAHPRLRRLAVLQRNGEIRGIDRQRGSVWAGRLWPHSGVTLPLRPPCELKALAGRDRGARSAPQSPERSEGAWFASLPFRLRPCRRVAEPQAKRSGAAAYEKFVDETAPVDTDG